MRTTVAMAAALLAPAAPAAAQAAPVICGSGTTIAAFPPHVRIIAVHFHEHKPENRGYHEYACTSAHARPLHVGESQGIGAAFSEDTERYVFAGGRYLAAGTEEEDEGGGSTDAAVYDLRTRRTVTGDVAVGYDDGFAFRLGPHGELVDDDGGILRVIAPGGRAHRLSNTARDVAVAGTTVYWTDANAVRSATLPGPASGAADRVLDIGDGATEPSRCRSRRGTTVAHSFSVRVARDGRRWFACKDGRRGAVELADDTRPASVWIAADRWLYSVCDDARVLDMRTQRLVTILPSIPARPPEILPNGTLAWIDADGTLLEQRRGEHAPHSTDAGASALTSVGSTLYWTSAGLPHRS